MKEEDGDRFTPMAQSASRRKARWPSLEAARAYALSKSMFEGWHPDALQGYLDGALMVQAAHHVKHGARAAAHTHAGGTGGTSSDTEVRLKCDPAFEAGIYTGWHNAYDHLHQVRAQTTVVAGGTVPFMSVFGDNDAIWADIVRRLPRGELKVMAQDGHLCVMTNPQGCADIAADGFGWRPRGGQDASAAAARPRL
jgi:hypothetical protein